MGVRGGRGGGQGGSIWTVCAVALLGALLLAGFVYYMVILCCVVCVVREWWLRRYLAEQSVVKSLCVSGLATACPFGFVLCSCLMCAGRSICVCMQTCACMADVGECPYIAQKCQARSRESAHVPYTCVLSHSGTHHTDQGFTTSRPRLSLRRRSRLRRSERIFLNEINVNECPSAEVRRANSTASSALSVSSIIPAPAGIGPSELAGQDDFWRRGGPQSGIDYRSDIGSITPMIKPMSMSCSHWR